MAGHGTTIAQQSVKLPFDEGKVTQAAALKSDRIVVLEPGEHPVLNVRSVPGYSFARLWTKAEIERHWRAAVRSCGNG